jgi:hypothetical protein
VATVSGAVTCNRPAYVTIEGQLSQVYQRLVVSGDFYFSVLCTSSNTWTAVVQPSNGLFSDTALPRSTRWHSGRSAHVDRGQPVRIGHAAFPKH